MKLEIGNVSEVTEITATTPLLDTTPPSLGQVIDQRRVQELPLFAGNARVDHAFNEKHRMFARRLRRQFENGFECALWTDLSVIPRTARVQRRRPHLQQLLPLAGSAACRGVHDSVKSEKFLDLVKCL
jgi:hypothetical protein